MINILKVSWQVVFLSIIAYIMHKLTDLLHLPIPGTILGIIVVFLLLKFNILKLSWIELGANWLLAHILLFFIPAAVGIMEFKNMIYTHGVSLVVIIILSTALVMACSGIIAQRLAHIKERKSS